MSSVKKAFITGIGGQDGFFLSKLLLEKGYKVFGVSNSPLTHLFPSDKAVWDSIEVVEGDFCDVNLMQKSLHSISPDEIYHFGAQSNVAKSYQCPEETYRVNIQGTLSLFQTISEMSPHAKVYFAGSSEMFGKVEDSPQTEETPFLPQSPYGISKVAAYSIAEEFKRRKGMFIATGITYNHESERRPVEFVTQKIIAGFWKIAHNSGSLPLELGNLDTQRDWGFAGDYVVAMHSLLQLPTPEKVIIATGVGHTVKEFLCTVAEELEMPLLWEGSGKSLMGKHADTGMPVVIIQEKYYRESEENPFIGNNTKARQLLNWKPTLSLKQLVKRMISVYK